MEECIFVTTFSNEYECILKEKYESQDVVRKMFNERMKEWEEKIYSALVSAGVSEEIVYSIPVKPAGHDKPHLPGIDY